MGQRGLITEHTWQGLSPFAEEQNDARVESIRQVMIRDSAAEAEEVDTARREAWHTLRRIQFSMETPGREIVSTRAQRLPDLG